MYYRRLLCSTNQGFKARVYCDFNASFFDLVWAATEAITADGPPEPYKCMLVSSILRNGATQRDGQSPLLSYCVTGIIETGTFA